MHLPPRPTRLLAPSRRIVPRSTIAPCSSPPWPYPDFDGGKPDLPPPVTVVAWHGDYPSLKWIRARQPPVNLPGVVPERSPKSHLLDGPNCLPTNYSPPPNLKQVPISSWPAHKLQQRSCIQCEAEFHLQAEALQQRKVPVRGKMRSGQQQHGLFVVNVLAEKEGKEQRSLPRESLCEYCQAIIKILL